MNPKYLPTDLNGKLVHVADECAEVTNVICKIQRFGIDFQHPFTGVRNREKLQEEITDLRGALVRLVSELMPEYDI